MIKNHLVLLFTALVLITGAILYLYNPEPSDYANPESVICTADALLCPDGSYVGRTGPNCEFEACPEPPPGTVMEDGTIENENSSSN